MSSGQVSDVSSWRTGSVSLQMSVPSEPEVAMTTEPKRKDSAPLQPPPPTCRQTEVGVVSAPSTGAQTAPAPLVLASGQSFKWPLSDALKMVQSQEKRCRTEKEIQEDVERLKDWLEKQPHLPHHIEESVLRWFVVGTKSLEIAKQKLDGWVSFRTKVPQLFSSAARNPLDPEFKSRSKATKIFFTPKATPDGYRAMWYMMGEDFSRFNHVQKLTRTTMQLELALRVYPDTKGIICVYDLAGLPNSVVTKMSAPNTAAGLQWFQSAVPLKMKKTVVFNAPPFAETLLNTLIKPFVKEKLFKRIVLTTEGDEALKNHLPDYLIPSDLNGKEKSSTELNAEWEKLMEDSADWFQKTSQLVADEKKRPADSNSSFGVEGTFRSLSID